VCAAIIAPVIVTTASCGAVLGLLDESYLREAGSDVLIQDEDVVEPPKGCPAGTKDCSGTCVPLDDPKYGCARPTCEPCSLPFSDETKCGASGACVVARCRPGFADCDGKPENGCEADLLSSATCGNCTIACPTAAPLCSAGQCVLNCASAETQCGTSCVNTSTSPIHCGACNKPCAALANADPTCKAGTCVLACRTNFGDCDNNPNNGCEPLSIFYKDGDGDGYGQTGATQLACTKPQGYADKGGDCLDSNNRVFPGQTQYFAVGYTNASGATSYDYDCDGVETEAPGFVHFTGSCPVCSGIYYVPNGNGANKYCGSASALACGSGSGSISGAGGCMISSASSPATLPCH
jgi:hypothetical protein